MELLIRGNSFQISSTQREQMEINKEAPARKVSLYRNLDPNSPLRIIFI